MNTQVIWAVVLIAVVGVVGYMVLGDDPTDTGNGGNEPEENGAEEMARTNELFDQLPYEIIPMGRRVIFDRDTISPEDRSEYAELPYEVMIGEETRLVESQMTMQEGETPIEFVERFIMQELPAEIPAQDAPVERPDDAYAFSVSFHEMDEEEVSEYPATDSPDAQPAEEGVSAYVQQMNLPDDSIGGEENRFDFIVTANDAWTLVWHGERTQCRRPDQEFWQPANELCP